MLEVEEVVNERDGRKKIKYSNFVQKVARGL